MNIVSNPIIKDIQKLMQIQQDNSFPKNEFLNDTMSMNPSKV